MARKKGAGYGTQSGEEDEEDPAAADTEAAGADPGGQGAGPGTAGEAEPQAGETPLGAAVRDVLDKYPPVEVIAGASICEVNSQRVVLARVVGHRVELTPEGQAIWDAELKAGQ